MRECVADHHQRTDEEFFQFPLQEKLLEQLSQAIKGPSFLLRRHSETRYEIRR